MSLRDVRPATTLPRGKRLYLHEVAPRDGLQIEPLFVATDKKIDLIDRLSTTGVAKIEVTSLVSPKAIPALADAEDVLRGIRRVDGVTYSALVPNARGCHRALACDVDELNLVMSASASHSRANLRMSPEQSLSAFEDILDVATGTGVRINASLSTAFGCPFEGDVAPSVVLGYVDRFEQMGIDGVSLCDTTGMANPRQVRDLCETVLARFGGLAVTAHFHDTRGMGLANALAALDAGIERFDASLGGLGGCPFAPGASGNVCMEDLVHMLAAMGFDTGVDLDRLLAIADGLPALVEHDVAGAVRRSGKFDRRYPVPAAIR